ncbi:hypothetical protein HAZT_HAZT000222 [Hyalella azteca]|uniref:EGF-like domain-containing protein n=1 Tax=Hyalella azteca TaxID=294128 RepID=A0A6A0GZ03_HYAAZ|nr:hypothetical protein HAZT_HAZT000222 [Hyalella azteca]
MQTSCAGRAQELCRPSPCGRNTNCQVQGERAVCTCLPNYVGDPLTGCRPECERDSHCPANFACQNNRSIMACDYIGLFSSMRAV